MKERPILFSGPMVRAILDGRKTQTRRIVKHKDVYLDVKGLGATNDELRQRANEPAIIHDANFGTDCPAELCPYGKPGDRLWVRETWCQKFKEDESGWVYNSEDNLDSSCVHYKADGYEVRAIDGDGFQRWNKDGSEGSPWKPSIHMPRWASRILLEVVSVRVERLDDISETDALAEGAPLDLLPDGAGEGGMFTCPTNWYACLWESINGKGSWAENPWVWVIEFKVIQP